MEVAQGGRKITAKGDQYLKDLEGYCNEEKTNQSFTLITE
jgi:hypothetical protein